MARVFRVEQVEVEGADVRFLADAAAGGVEYAPAGKMLTDSDDHAFLYLLDGPDGYSEVRIPEFVWSALSTAVEGARDPVLALRDARIPLAGFYEEFEALVFNIEGNGNYGGPFVQAVEAAFAGILAR